jgi:hypothetical protein
MKTELKGILNQNDHNEEMSNIIKNLSSIYSSISDGLIKVSNYLSKYQLLRENKSKIKNDGEDFFDVVCPEEYISGAFKWSHTPEGSIFWCDLHLIWNDKTYVEDLW